ncbi:MAG: hypothetical protein SangKO_099010 [Sandaracinaceae bacterium]
MTDDVAAGRGERSVAPLSILPMPFPLTTHSGDGASSPIATPGELIVTAFIPSSEVSPGPSLPLVLSRVSAGFPSPADDYVEGHLDLHELTNALSPSCYWMRADGESMVGAGILSGDLLLVDRAVEPQNGDVVVAAIDGELTVKRFSRHRGRPRLLAANPAYPSIELADGQELVVWGVVTFVLHNARGRS